MKKGILLAFFLGILEPTLAQEVTERRSRDLDRKSINTGNKSQLKSTRLISENSNSQRQVATSSQSHPNSRKHGSQITTPNQQSRSRSNSTQSANDGNSVISSSSSSHQNTTQSQSASNSRSTPSAATQPQFCIGPSNCDNGPAKEEYRWEIPTYSPYGHTDRSRYISGFDTFEQPQQTCDKSKDGQMISVNFGHGPQAMVCMNSNTSNAKPYIEKVQAADPTQLQQSVAVAKDKYEWQLTREPTVPYGVSNGLPLCNSDSVGSTAEPGRGAAYKCVKIEGGEISAAQAEPAATSPAQSSPVTPSAQASASQSTQSVQEQERVPASIEEQNENGHGRHTKANMIK